MKMTYLNIEKKGLLNGTKELAENTVDEKVRRMAHKALCLYECSYRDSSSPSQWSDNASITPWNRKMRPIVPRVSGPMKVRDLL